MDKISIKASKLLKLLKTATEKEETAWACSYRMSSKEIKEPASTSSSSCMSDYNFICEYKGISFRIAMERMTDFESEEQLFKHLQIVEDENDPGDMAEVASKNKKRKRRNKKKRT